MDGYTNFTTSNRLELRCRHEWKRTLFGVWTREPTVVEKPFRKIERERLEKQTQYILQSKQASRYPRLYYKVMTQNYMDSNTESIRSQEKATAPPELPFYASEQNRGDQATHYLFFFFWGNSNFSEKEKVIYHR